MNKLKTFILLGICFVYMCSLCHAQASPPQFVLSVTSETVKPGEDFFLVAEIKNNKSFGALQFCIEYDKDKLSAESVALGELIPADSIFSINTDIPGEINFSAVSIKDIEGDGTLLVSKLRAKAEGTVMFDLKLIAYADLSGTSLDSACQDAVVEIKAAESNSSAKRPGGSSTGLRDTDKKDQIPDNVQAEEAKEDKQIYFSDVPKSHWAHVQIHRVSEMGLFSGTGETFFSPDIPMTRAMFVTVLHRYAGSPDAEKATFTDIEDSWYTDAVSWAAHNGIVSGTGENKFSPDEYITRGQIATILCRYKNGKSMDVNSINSFNDSGLIPDWGRESSAWAIEQGLIMGRTGGNIAFNDNATRAETAVIFTRFLNIR